MGLLEPQHILLIVIALLLFFGGKKIPELMRGVGRGIREFKDAKDNVQRELEDGMKDDHKVNTTSSTPTSTNKPVSSGSSVNN